MIRSLRKLVSLPAQWAGQVAATFNQPVGATLLTLAWRISGDGETAWLAWGARGRRDGGEAASRWAQEQLARSPRSKLAAVVGLRSVDEGNLELARQMHAQAGLLGGDRDGLTEILEYTIACRHNDRTGTRETVAKLAQRRDLPGELSRLLLVELMWEDMLSGRYDDAHVRADRLLEVANDGVAEMALWALALRNGNEQAAAQHESLAAKTAAPAQLLWWRMIGLLALGRQDEALAAMEALEQQDELAGRLAREMIGQFQQEAWR